MTNQVQVRTDVRNASYVRLQRASMMRHPGLPFAEVFEIEHAEALAEDARRFSVGSKPLARITGAAAELLLEAHTVGTRFGVELGGLFDKETARECEEGEFGTVHLECGMHGGVNIARECRFECEPDLYQVFLINDAGTAWLEDAGKI